MKFQTKSIKDLRYRGYSIANIAKLKKVKIKVVYESLNMEPGDEFCTATRHTGVDTDSFNASKYLSMRWI